MSKFIEINDNIGLNFILYICSVERENFESGFVKNKNTIEHFIEDRLWKS